MKHWRNRGLFALLTLAAAGLLLRPSLCAEAAREGLSLCFETVLPSLFPFFVLSSLLIACGAADALARALEGWMRPLFSLSGAGACALVLGLCGGYPLGARTAAQLWEEGRLSRAEAERLLGFCNNAGPGFILGVCGGAVFGNPRAGALLYLVHAAAALLTGMLFSIGQRPEPLPRGRASVSGRGETTLVKAFPAAVQGSFTSVWNVCGFVVLFMVLLRLLASVLPGALRESALYPLLLGCVEMTNGVLALSGDRRGFVLCAALLGWGGWSVHAQTLSVTGGLDTRWYWRGKLTQAALSVPLALLASRLL